MILIVPYYKRIEEASQYVDSTINSKINGTPLTWPKVIMGK